MVDAVCGWQRFVCESSMLWVHLRSYEGLLLKYSRFLDGKQLQFQFDAD